MTSCSEGVVLTCVIGDLGCLEWQVLEACAVEPAEIWVEAPTGAECALDCTGECVPLQERCNADVIELCQDSPTGCNEWVPLTDCSAAEPPMTRVSATGPACGLAPDAAERCASALVVAPPWE